MSEELQSSARKYFDISETIKRVGRIKQLLTGFVDKDLSKEDFKAMVKQVLKVMPQDLSLQKVQDSLAHLYGRPLTEQIVKETAWRLSGNTELLRKGEAVTQDVAVTKEGWCAVQVLNARPILRNPKSKERRLRGCLYNLMVISGHAAGSVIDKFISLRYVKYMSNDLGFTPPFKDYPFKDERELFGMRFGALFIPSMAKEGKPGFQETHVSPSMALWNKQILKKRNREGYTCPLGMTSEQLPCFRCWKGAQSCVASVHQKDFEQDYCEFCGQESVFDPGAVGYVLGMCVNCQRQEDTTGISMRKKVDARDGTRPS